MNWLGVFTRDEPLSASVLLQNLQRSETTDERLEILQQLEEICEEQQEGIAAGVETLLHELEGERTAEEERTVVEILLRASKGSSAAAAQLRQSITATGVSRISGLARRADAGVRWAFQELLRLLLRSDRSAVQRAIVTAGPLAVAPLTDLLSDRREVVRNASLLLLAEVSVGHSELQKILAFEGIFDVLLQLIRAEGYAQGGIIVADSLRLCRVLLAGNPSNQNYFRETSCLSYLPPLLELSGSDEWLLTDDQTHILWLTVDILASLLDGPATSVKATQSALLREGVAEKLVTLALGNVSAVSVRVAALGSLARLVRFHSPAAQFFAAAVVPKGHPNTPSGPSALQRALQVALQAPLLAERQAALSLLQASLVGHSDSQLAVASTLTPPPEGPTELSSHASLGTQLLQAFSQWESEVAGDSQPLASWSAAHILSWTLEGNKAGKELVLRIPLELPRSGVPMVTLLTRCLHSLALSLSTLGTGRWLLQVAVLKLLLLWSEDSPATVHAVLSSPSHVPTVVELVQTEGEGESPSQIQGLAALLLGLWWEGAEDKDAKGTLEGILRQRIGVESWQRKMESWRRSSPVGRAEAGETELWITRTSSDSSPVASGQTSLSYYDHHFVTWAKSAMDRLTRQLGSPSPSPSLGSGSSLSSGPSAPTESSETVLQSYKELLRTQERQMETLRKENEELESQLTSLKVNDRSAEVKQLQSQLKELQQFGSSSSTSEDLVSLSKAYNDLEKVNLQQEKEIQRLGEMVVGDVSNHQTQEVSNTNSQPTKELEEQIENLSSANISLQMNVNSLTIEKEDLLVQLEGLRNNLRDEQLKYQSLEQEQEELLLALANQEIETSTLRGQLGLDDDVL